MKLCRNVGLCLDWAKVTSLNAMFFCFIVIAYWVNQCNSFVYFKVVESNM